MNTILGPWRPPVTLSRTTRPWPLLLSRRPGLKPRPMVRSRPYDVPCPSSLPITLCDKSYMQRSTTLPMTRLQRDLLQRRSKRVGIKARLKHGHLAVQPRFTLLNYQPRTGKRYVTPPRTTPSFLGGSMANLPVFSILFASLHRRLVAIGAHATAASLVPRSPPHHVAPHSFDA